MDRYGDTYTLIIANADKYEDRRAGRGAVREPAGLAASGARARAHSQTSTPPPPNPHAARTTHTQSTQHREVKLDTTVTSYFHSDGYLAEAKFRGHVSKLVGQYELLDKAHEGSRPKALNPKKQQ